MALCQRVTTIVAWPACAYAYAYAYACTRGRANNLSGSERLSGTGPKKSPVHKPVDDFSGSGLALVGECVKRLT
ncbi:hypothetical protein DEF98_009040 [Xanthomonas vasicola]|nr:hypothetical protein DEF98_009040 [Xanthomonas vasicola]RJL90376.1 hypothetical protein DEF95_011375 [Xanthomonas vasicola]RJL96736.1 hypothetical protein DEF96_009735 [Xanthomonas vasicola]RJN02301.1 hypothetical protein DEF97_010085 [Xanthomonas vasicola]